MMDFDRTPPWQSQLPVERLCALQASTAHSSRPVTAPDSTWHQSISYHAAIRTSDQHPKRPRQRSKSILGEIAAKPQRNAYGVKATSTSAPRTSLEKPAIPKVAARPSITPHSSNSGKSNYSKATYTSFYSSSTSSLESLGTSPATSMESLGQTSSSGMPRNGAKPVEKHTSTSRASTDKRRFSRPRRFSLRRPSMAIADAYDMPTDLPAGPVSPAMFAPRKSISMPRKSFTMRRSSSAARPEYTRSSSHRYRDPEATKRLKQGLASAQHFEEALAYGFAPKPSSPLLSPRNQPDFSDNHLHAFLNDSQFLDDSSQFGRDTEDEDHADSSDDEEDIPASYINFNEQAYDPSPKRPSRKSTASRPSASRHRKNIEGDMFGEREMTLRLTLTKPEIHDGERALGQRQQLKAIRRDRYAADEPLAMRDHMTVTHAKSNSRDEGGAGKVQGLLRKLRQRR